MNNNNNTNETTTTIFMGCDSIEINLVFGDSFEMIF